MLPIFKDDPELRAHESHIMNRVNAFRGWKELFRKSEGGIEALAEGYKTFGFQRHEAEKKWTFTEWLPAAKKVFLVGEFNGWEKTHPLTRCDYGRWTVELPDQVDGRWLVPHRSQVRLRVESCSGTFDRVPAWTKFAENTALNVYNGVMWEPPAAERYVMRHARPRRPRALKIYEAHVGAHVGADMGTEAEAEAAEAGVHTYLDFKAQLPKIKSLGYNAVQFLAVAEHSDYASMGQKVTSFFAPSSRFGTPDEFKELVDAAHAHGLTVLMNLVHFQLSPHQLDGIADMDGTDCCYRHSGSKGWQEQTRAALFDYSKYEVLRFLLSNVRWWIEEYGVDGFCFAGVTSMLYHSHGIGKSFSSSQEHFGWDADLESATYLMLANHLVKRLLPSSGITLAEDHSGMPVLCRTAEDGGLGFDYRLAPSGPRLWAKMLQEPDEAWNVTNIVRAMKPRRQQEPSIFYTESHEALSDSKTLGSFLLGPGCDQERGLALHKLLRMVTLGLSGEGYLNFMGNEFAFQEALSMRLSSGALSGSPGSPSSCFLEAFDEAMIALEARFRFASSSSTVSRKDDSDKVLVFERGDCLFAFNFHPTRSYTECRVSHSWNERLRVVLDSDEARFGGQDRLRWAHDEALPSDDARSARLSLPSRSFQVLVRESLLEGGVVVRLPNLSTSAWPFPANELRLLFQPLLQTSERRPFEDQATEVRFTASEGRLCTRLSGPSAFKVYWEVQKGRMARGAPAKVKLPFALDIYRVHFPGTYVLDCFGNLTCAGNSDDSVQAENDVLCEGDGVPPGCKDTPLAQSRPQYVRPQKEEKPEPKPEPKLEPKIETKMETKLQPKLEDEAPPAPLVREDSLRAQNFPTSVIEVGHCREVKRPKRRAMKAEVEASAEAVEAKRCHSASQHRPKKAEEESSGLCKEDLDWLQAKKMPLQDTAAGQPEPEPQAPSVVSVVTASRAQENARRREKKSSKKEAADFLGLCPKEITLQRSEKPQVTEVEASKVETPFAEKKVTEVEAAKVETPVAETKEVKRSTSRRRQRKVEAPNVETPTAEQQEAKEAKRTTSRRPPRTPRKVVDVEAKETPTAETKEVKRTTSKRRSKKAEQCSREASVTSMASAASGTSATSGASKASRASSRSQASRGSRGSASAASSSTAEVPPRAWSGRPPRKESPVREPPVASEQRHQAPKTRQAEQVSREASVTSVASASTAEASPSARSGRPPRMESPREVEQRQEESPAREVSVASVPSVTSQEGNPQMRTVRVSKFQQAKQARLNGERMPEKASVTRVTSVPAPLVQMSTRKGSFSLLPDTQDCPKEQEIVQGGPLMLKKGSLSLLPDCDDRQEFSAHVMRERPTALRVEDPLPVRAPFEEKREARFSVALSRAKASAAASEAATDDGYSSGTQTPKTKAVSESSRSESGDGSLERVYSLSALDALLQDPEEKADLRSHLETELKDNRPKYQSAHLSTPVVIVSSEVNPWSKTGGLAMVAGSYGYEFAMRGHRTMVVSPRYGEYKDAHYVGFAKIWLDGCEHEVRYFHLYQDLGDGKGTDYVFVDHESYHRGGLYVDREGREYADNLLRYALLTVAAMEAPLVLSLQGSTYGQDVLFIANDWQTGLLPVYHLYKYRRNRTYLNSRCLFVIHNIGYQGKYRLSKFPLDSYLGLPPEAIDLMQGEDLNLGADCMNLMSAAILASDRVLTVSPNYATEVQSPEGGQGLHAILTEKGRQMRMAGILNGIADEWDPRTDPHIPRNYGLSDFLEGKAHAKRELQRSLGLHEDPGAALMGFCGRLCFQKGVHLITEVIPWLLTYENSGVLGRVQVILMGKGEDTYANQLSHAENTNRGRVCGYVGFDPKVEHRMMAGCDFLLMPSQYEPCGLPQMYAQAYGAVPVVHETGGLKDSVLGLWDERRDQATATGFLFSGFDANTFKERLYQALEVFHKKPDMFRRIQQNGLRKNYYWPQAIDEYERHLDWTLESPLAVG